MGIRYRQAWKEVLISFVNEALYVFVRLKKVNLRLHLF
jgi:hypothetical protein